VRYRRTITCALILVATSACGRTSESVDASSAASPLEVTTTTRHRPCPGDPGYAAGFGGGSSALAGEVVPNGLWGEVTDDVQRWPTGEVMVENELIGPDTEAREPGSDVPRSRAPLAPVAEVARAVAAADATTRILLNVRGGNGLVAIIDGPDVEFLTRCPVADDDYFYTKLDAVVNHDSNDDYRTHADVFLAMINQDRNTGDVWQLREELFTTTTTVDPRQAWEEAGPMDRSAVPIADPLPLDVAGSLTPGTLTLHLPDGWRGLGDDSDFCTRNPHGFNPCLRLSFAPNYPADGEPPIDLAFFYVSGQPVEVYIGGPGDPERILLGSFVPDEHEDPRNITLTFTPEAHETTSRAEVAALAARGPIIQTR
jgi:hypothetical protein